MPKRWYPAKVLLLAQEETRERVKMAAKRVRDLLDSGWEPTIMEAVDKAFAIFSQCTKAIATTHIRI